MSSQNAQARGSISNLRFTKCNVRMTSSSKDSRSRPHHHPLHYYRLHVHFVPLDEGDKAIGAEGIRHLRRAGPVAAKVAAATEAGRASAIAIRADTIFERSLPVIVSSIVASSAWGGGRMPLSAPAARFTTTDSTSNSSRSTNAIRPPGPKAAGISMAPAA